MLEIAGGILIAVFVLVFLRVFIALGVLVIGCILLGLAIYFFDLDWVLHFLKYFLINPVFWVIGVLFIIGHLSFRKTDKLEKNIQANHNLLYNLQNLNLRLKENKFSFTIEPKKQFAYRHFYEVNIGNFWVLIEKYQFSFSKTTSQPRIKFLDLNKKELFSIGSIAHDGYDTLSYISHNINFDYELLGVELGQYLSSFYPKKDIELEYD